MTACHETHSTSILRGRRWHERRVYECGMATRAEAPTWTLAAYRAALIHDRLCPAGGGDLEVLAVLCGKHVSRNPKG